MLSQLINKFPVNLTAVNILVFLVIGQIIYAVWSLYKVYISCNIAYKTIVIIYFLITDILIEVHIVL